MADYLNNLIGKGVGKFMDDENNSKVLTNEERLEILHNKNSGNPPKLIRPVWPKIGNKVIFKGTQPFWFTNIIDNAKKILKLEKLIL